MAVFDEIAGNNISQHLARWKYCVYILSKSDKLVPQITPFYSVLGTIGS